MTEPEATWLVSKALPAMRDTLGITGWRLDFTYPRLDPGCKGQSSIDAAYKEAWIRLDPHQAEGERDFLETMRHELLHVALWPMQALIDVRRGDADLDDTERFFLERLVAEVEGILSRADPIIVPPKEAA